MAVVQCQRGYCYNSAFAENDASVPVQSHT